MPGPVLAPPGGPRSRQMTAGDHGRTRAPPSRTRGAGHSATPLWRRGRDLLVGIGLVAVAVMPQAPQAQRVEHNAQDGDDAKDEEERVGHVGVMMHDGTIERGCAI